MAVTIGPNDHEIEEPNWADLGWTDIGYIDDSYWSGPKGFTAVEAFDRYAPPVGYAQRWIEDYDRADGFTQEQVDLHCSCSYTEGIQEDCKLHGRWPWSGDWIGAKRVTISEDVPPGVIIATPTEVFVTQEGWDTIYKLMAIKVEAVRAVRRIVERELATELAWLRRAGHDV